VTARLSSTPFPHPGAGMPAERKPGPGHTSPKSHLFLHPLFPENGGNAVFHHKTDAVIIDPGYVKIKKNAFQHMNSGNQDKMMKYPKRGEQSCF
jgi:hypothetical protein